jgi:hypothetical protein
MAINKTIFDFLKTKINPFLKRNPHISKETITDFISKVSDDIVYASIVTRKELIETLVIKGIDRKFVNKHLDTLLKIEAVNFKDITVVPQQRFVKDCIDLMDKWFFQSKDNPDPFYKEVRHDYFDTDSECWVIDCWRTDDDDEEGVAPIEVYLDGSLKIRDENAFGFAICELNIIEAIEEVLKQIKSENKG